MRNSPPFSWPGPGSSAFHSYDGHRRRCRICLPITFLLLSSFLPASHADERRAALLAGPCVVCHGGSNADTQIPPLQGKSASDIEKAMQDFRAGRRPSTIMARHARGYTEEEIRLIAGYLASQSDPVDR